MEDALETASEPWFNRAAIAQLWRWHLERRGETEQSLRDTVVDELRERAILDKLGKLEVTAEELMEALGVAVG